MKKENKLNTLIVFFFLVFSFYGCISLYPKLEKIPCAELGKDAQSDLRKIIISSGFKEKDIIMTDSSVQYTKKKTIEFAEISKAIVITKRLLKGKRYTIVTVMKSREKHAFETYDYKLALRVYSTIECLGGVKPRDTNSSGTDKYDKLVKLKTLLDSGAISKEEYELEKEKILKAE